MNCSIFQRHLEAFVDAELDPTTQVEFEGHQESCAECQERLAFARVVKATTRSQLAHGAAPVELRARLHDALAKAPAAHEDEPLIRWVPARGRTAMWAIAAVVLLALGLHNGPFGGAQQASTLPMFEDVVRLHSAELPPDVRGHDQVSSWFRNRVEFPVRPAEFGDQSVRLVGARLSNVRERRAAALYYETKGRRVTVVVFNPGVALSDVDGEHGRVGPREVFYVRVGGYIVPAVQQDGVVYAFTGDFDRETLLRLAASARLR